MYFYLSNDVFAPGIVNEDCRLMCFGFFFFSISVRLRLRLVVCLVNMSLMFKLVQKWRDQGENQGRMKGK